MSIRERFVQAAEGASMSKWLEIVCEAAIEIRQETGGVDSAIRRHMEPLIADAEAMERLEKTCRIHVSRFEPIASILRELDALRAAAQPKCGTCDDEEGYDKMIHDSRIAEIRGDLLTGEQVSAFNVRYLLHSFDKAVADYKQVSEELDDAHVAMGLKTSASIDIAKALVRFWQRRVDLLKGTGSRDE